MSYIDVWEHSRGGEHTDVDWRSIFEDLYSPELDFMDICVTSVFLFLLQLHKFVGCTHTAHCALQLTIECWELRELSLQETPQDVEVVYV